MSEKNKTCANKPSVGGQALIEGVMMTGPGGTVLSVRHKSAEIVTETVAWPHIKDKIKFLGWPLIRGVVNYIETMKMGYKTLMRSAELSGQLEDEEDPENMSKLDRWRNDHMGPTLLGAVSAVASVLAMVLGVFLFVWLPVWLVDIIDEKLFTGFSFDRLHPLFEGVIRGAVMVLYMFLVSRLKDIRRVFMYHGAEHKSIACFEKGWDLTVENVKKCTRFHPRCGTSFIFIILIVSIIVSSVIMIIFPQLGDKSMRLIWVAVKLFAVLPIVTGVSYELLKYAGRHTNLFTRIFSAPGLWMQRITTSEPTDDMMEVAIASIKAVTADMPAADYLAALAAEKAKAEAAAPGENL